MIACRPQVHSSPRLGFQTSEGRARHPGRGRGRLLASAPDAGAGRGRRRGQLTAGQVPGQARPAGHLRADRRSRCGATYGDLDTAFRAVRAGAELLATQANRIALRDDGEHLDTGG